MVNKIINWWKYLRINKNNNVVELTKQKVINNITETELVTLEGKEYYRVKVKFVDSMSFDLAKHLDTLETQNEELVKQIDALKLENKKLTDLNTDLNRLNINLYTEIRILKSEKIDFNRLMTKLLKKATEIYSLKGEIKELNKLLKKQSDEVSESNVKEEKIGDIGFKLLKEIELQKNKLNEKNKNLPKMHIKS